MSVGADGRVFVSSFTVRGLPVSKEMPMAHEFTNLQKKNDVNKQIEVDENPVKPKTKKKRPDTAMEIQRKANLKKIIIEQLTAQQLLEQR